MTANAPSMTTEEAIYTIDELAAVSGVPSRTIRFYQSKGALPKPKRKGRVAFYGSEHLERLKLIGQLQDRGLRIRAIRDLVEQVDRGELALSDWLGLEEQLQAAWADDRPQMMEERELRRLTEEVRPGLFADIVRFEMAVPEGGQYLVRSPGLLQVALRLEKAGIDIQVMAGAQEIATKHLRRAAAELSEFFGKHTGEGFGRGMSIEAVAHAFLALKPLGLEAVRLIFAHEMERIMRRMVERGGAAKIHGEKVRSKGKP